MKLHRLYIQFATLLFVSSSCANAQVFQNSPELCGSSDGRSVHMPDGLSINVSPGQGTAILTTSRGAALRLPGVREEITQVCVLPDNRLLLFGRAVGAYNVVIIDRALTRVLDSFYAYDPKVSPDQRWIVSRAFYPPQSDVTFSDEYVLYDLEPQVHTERMAPSQASKFDPETVIYPVIDGHRKAGRTALPPEQTHQFCSEEFYWSSDSRFLGFADCVKDSMSLVVTDVQQRETFVHKLSSIPNCSQNTTGASSASKVTEMVVDPGGNMTVRFSADRSCIPGELILGPSDFTPARREPSMARKKQPAIRNPE